MAKSLLLVKGSKTALRYRRQAYVLTEGVSLGRRRDKIEG